MNNYLHWLQRSQINSGLGDFCIVLNEDNKKVQLLHLYPTERFLMYHTIHLQCYSQPRSQDPSPWLGMRAGLAQWWEHSPTTNVARVRFRPRRHTWAEFVGSLLSLLCYDSFLFQILRFSTLTKSQKFDLICCDLVWFVISSISKPKSTET